jgi:F420-non-reducing hydrogenase small subunit
MPAKVRVATAWLQGCAGCHMAFLDLHHFLIDLFDLIDIQYSPLVDAKQIPEVDICLIEGAVANTENEKNLKTMRERSKILIALGTCACTGGITGFRNLTTREKALTCGYIDTPTTVNGRIPSGEAVPQLKEVVQALHQVVAVDYAIPGCPPTPQAIREAVTGLINGNPPKEKTHNLCEGCHRTKDRMLVARRDFLIDEVFSVHELEHIDPHTCFLEQGVLCMGPATREGCGVLCPKANMPCRGCQGPPHGAPEQGAKLINCLSSLLPAGGLMFHEDIQGMGYCFSMPVSIYPHLEIQKGEGSRE